MTFDEDNFLNRANYLRAAIFRSMKLCDGKSNTYSQLNTLLNTLNQQVEALLPRRNETKPNQTGLCLPENMADKVCKLIAHNLRGEGKLCEPQLGHMYRSVYETIKDIDVWCQSKARQVPLRTADLTR